MSDLRVVNGRTSWALVIATYNRADMLCLAVRLAFAQTRKPSEVVIVDASSDWESTRQAVLAMAKDHPEITIQYVPAQEKSLAVQRNQGAELANADVLFMIDDDSLLYPDCAEYIMAVYDADVNCEVAGIQATLLEEPPGTVTVSAERKSSGAKRRLESGSLPGLKDWIRREVLMMDVLSLFIPYDGGYPGHPIPQALAAFPVERALLFHGCRMTYRREAVLKEGFESLLRSYCPGEDLDASYRISRHGVMLTCVPAHINHHAAAGGRINRYKVSALSALNQAVCLRLHAVDVARARRAFRLLMLRRILAETIKDGLSRRWSFPQVRGLALALYSSHKIWAMDRPALERTYVPQQLELLRR